MPSTAATSSGTGRRDFLKSASLLGATLLFGGLATRSLGSRCGAVEDDGPAAPASANDAMVYLALPSPDDIISVSVVLAAGPDGVDGERFSAGFLLRDEIALLSVGLSRIRFRSPSRDAVAPKGSELEGDDEIRLRVIFDNGRGLMLYCHGDGSVGVTYGEDEPVLQTDAKTVSAFKTWLRSTAELCRQTGPEDRDAAWLRRRDRFGVEDGRIVGNPHRVGDDKSTVPADLGGLLRPVEPRPLADL
jgi:hypothetical protein